MQPDMKSPGPIEVSPATSNAEGGLAVSKEAKAERVATPNPSAQQASTGQAVQASAPATTADSAASEDTKQNTQSFESRIATLPAEEADTIEQAWVDQADAIEDKTARDPYHQDDAQHALSRAYLKKRFGMDVK